jgi:hypothetical protein
MQPSKTKSNASGPANCVLIDWFKDDYCYPLKVLMTHQQLGQVNEDPLMHWIYISLPSEFRSKKWQPSHNNIIIIIDGVSPPLAVPPATVLTICASSTENHLGLLLNAPRA